IRRQSGTIVTISSMWGEVGASCEAAYSATKGAVISMTKALAKEVAPSHIRVNCVSPGTVMTDMMSHFNEDEIEAIRLDTPLEVLGTPKNVADAVYFLSSEESSFITGQILGVNGGFVI
ncbi:MAG: SDR family oxidoreductase, partial [Oscillospiraceae bacterium]|nr:SDR family oxidoreductase [Oscillospiraceae bacterium]